MDVVTVVIVSFGIAIISVGSLWYVLKGTEEIEMADDKSKVGEQDRSRVSAEEDYEVQYVAKEAGISVEMARELIKQYGPDRHKVMEAAKRS